MDVEELISQTVELMKQGKVSEAIGLARAIPVSSLISVQAELASRVLSYTTENLRLCLITTTAQFVPDWKEDAGEYPEQSKEAKVAARKLFTEIFAQLVAGEYQPRLVVNGELVEVTRHLIRGVAREIMEGEVETIELILSIQREQMQQQTLVATIKQ